MMRKTIATLAAALWLTGTASAQTFLDHLQKDEKSSGQVSVKQSEDISKLVNGNKDKEKSPSEAPKASGESGARNESRSESPSRSEEHKSDKSRYDQRDNGSTRSDEERDKERRERERKAREAARAKKLKEFEENTTVSDSRLKVMSNSKRSKGYRIQVFAGANTRADRAKAHEIGAKVKAEIPGQPVYVHFYSPRWCCRFGNFRRMDDATNVLKKIKKMGYKNACVIKTIITVNK